MSANTNIEWTDATWPVVRGCTKISPGCANCWAIFAQHPNPNTRAHFEGLTVIENRRPNWNGQVRLDESILHWPRQWDEPKKVFVASSGDLFHEKLPARDIAEVFRVMYKVPHHTYQVLTKRAHLMEAHSHRIRDTFGSMPHVWLGVSVEDQRRADQLRAPMKLLAALGWNTWVSNEPALGPIDWTGWEFLRWMVTGGESGPGSRPSDPHTIRASRNWSVRNGVPFLFKQWGDWKPTTGGMMERIGKKAAGRNLDGVTWNQFPGAMVMRAAA